jgi:hypothetical protein
MTPQKDPIYTCWICGNRVLLEECKTDEHGKAVHERCYQVRIELQNGSKSQDKQHSDVRHN